MQIKEVFQDIVLSCKNNVENAFYSLAALTSPDEAFMYVQKLFNQITDKDAK